MSTDTAALTPLKFNNKLNSDFSKLLNKRINEYFKSVKSGRYANGEMIFKTVFMLMLYITPFVVALSLPVTTLGMYCLFMVVMGLGKAGIGLSVMHDANHGAYSHKKRINDVVGYSLNLVGANVINWKIQHNVKHHTYTNIHGHDEDISPKGGLIRLSPHSELKKHHKYQFIYAWFVYGLMTFYWILAKDIIQLVSYTKDGMLKKQMNVTKAWTVLIVTKIVYLSYILVLPTLITPLAFWEVFIGFFVMHYIAGFILAVVFQPAHVLEENEFPMPSESGVVESNWTVHQLLTTSNFAQNNRLLSWFVGGLNYQVEHHLFPNVCHVHYRKISKIVKETAGEYGIPYKSYPSFRSAMLYHGKMLYWLGRHEQVKQEVA